MKKPRELIKICKVVLIVNAALCVIVPLVVHFLFKWKSGIEWITAEWEAGDILAYCGCVLTGVGTVLLGYVTATIENHNEERNELLQWHPKVRAVGVTADSTIHEKDLKKEALVLDGNKYKDIDSKYRCFYITFENVGGLEPDKVKVVDVAPCRIYFNNGHRRGKSFIQHKTDVVSDESLGYNNCEELKIISDDYINIVASVGNNFKIPLFVEYASKDDKFSEDLYESINNKSYGLMLTLKFVNSLGFYEEGLYTLLSSPDNKNYNKTRVHFGKENKQ